ncbi:MULTISPECIES: AfsR/SARP family transcriptional regulator [Actinomycetes]|uniref:BTAD domain-containing putative transcriptional regulator n=2 Tax=Actinomycetes TaxID=1760 RepID=A0ABP6M132_9MICC
MKIEVLGPIRLRTSTGQAVEVRERKVRAVLAALAVDLGDAVPADTLIDRVWGGDLPAHPTRVLQAKLSQLRSALDETEPGGRALLSSGPGGHRLSTSAPAPAAGGPGATRETDRGLNVAVDAEEFRQLIVRARGSEALAERTELLRAALQLWRGEPYAELRDATWLAPEIGQLHELRLEAAESLAEALLEAGQAQESVTVLEPLAAHHPLRARLTRALMLALHRAHRHPDALGVYERHRRHLAEELGADPDPETSHLHVRILQQDPQLQDRPQDRDSALPRPHAAAHRPAAAPTPRLPVFASSFLGRTPELREVELRLTRGPLVTVLGIGGVGKTRLAVRAAELLTEKSGDAAWFVDLSSLDACPPPDTGPARVARLVAESIGLTQLREESRDLLDRLTAALQATGGLLLLDNCEHVADEAARFAHAVLSAGNALTILATSREPLGLPGEQRLALTPLSAQAPDDDAVTFFLDRARAVTPDLPEDPHTLAVVAELCRRLDGLPLALELAAAQTAALDPTRLLDRLTDRLDLLSRPERGAPRRQQTLRGMLDWSWSLLDEPERVLLRRLAVHPVSWTVETIESVCADSQDGPLRCAAVVPALVSLVDRSLVVAEPTEHGTRYRLLESVGAYAAEQLRLAGEREHIARLHREHWRTEISCAQDHLFSAHARDWVRRIRAERAHLRHAFAEAVAVQDGAAAVDLILAWFWHRWITGETAGLLDELRQAAACPGPHDGAHAQVQVLIAVLSGSPGESTADILEALDRLRDRTESSPGGPSHRAQRSRLQVQWFAATPLLVVPESRARGRQVAGEAVEGLVALGDLPAAAFASTQRDWFLLDAGEPAVGMPDGHDAEQILREHGDDYGLTQVLGMRHIQAERDGDREVSAAAAREATDLSRRLGARGEECFWEAIQGLHALDAGDHTGAHGHLDRSLALGRTIGSDIEAGFATLGLAELAAREGDQARAAALRDSAVSPTAERWLRRILSEPSVLSRS